MNAGAVIVGVLAGVIGLLAASRRAAAAGGGPSLPPTASNLPGVPAAAAAKAAEVENRVAAAIASENPVTMETEAAALEAMGWRQEAQVLREEAARRRAGAPVVPVGGLPPTTGAGRAPPPLGTSGPPPRPPSLPIPTTRGSAGPPEAPTYPPPRERAPAPWSGEPAPVVLPEVTVYGDTENPRRVAAQQVTDYLRSIGGLKGRWKEDRSRVLAYQQGEGLSADGKYGSGTALSILERHGIIPVAPFYWPKAGAAQVKSTFIARVRDLAAGDPERAAQYTTLIADTQRS